MSIIISTGDISDVDGFFALAEYAKTGADVLFIMNYPAYIGTSASEVELNPATRESEHRGLGYKYSAKEVFDQVASPAPKKYKEFLSKYRTEPTEPNDNDLVKASMPSDSDALKAAVSKDNDAMKAAMTDMSFQMAKDVWKESCDLLPPSSKRGDLFFCVGGINSINPFSASSIKNEVLVYSDVLLPPNDKLSIKEGTFFDAEGKEFLMDWSKYSKVYMDFNGSMAFLNESWRAILKNLARKIKSIFIMGGVCANSPPLTMPAIANVLNRFSTATMNQLYHPENTAKFLDFVDRSNIPSYIVTNNAVSDLTTYDAEDPKKKTLKGVTDFLTNNAIGGEFLHKLAQCYYESRYNPPRKPFDAYTAFALRAAILADEATEAPPAEAAPAAEAPAAGRSAAGVLEATPRRLFYCAKYGVALVGEANSKWAATRDGYAKQIDTVPKGDDVPFVRAKKLNYILELAAMRAIDPPLPFAAVLELKFDLDKDTRRLRIIDPGPAAAAGSAESAELKGLAWAAAAAAAAVSAFFFREGGGWYLRG